MKRCAQCGTEHEGEALFCRKDGTPLAAGTSTDPLVGQVVLGQFLVESILGEGGMGTVYRAHQTGIDRKVAIKVLRSDVASQPGVAERFTREARLASRIKSPHVAHVYVTGTLPNGNPMLAMEYLEGRSLDDLLIESAPLPLARAVHIMRQIGEATAEAHELGIVHRDLKPENVMLVRSGEDAEFVKVLDFGIAKQLGPDAASLTGAGVALGTPLYMSPEAAAGEEIGMPADVYALGIIFYQALCGETPFAGDSPTAVLVQHLQNDPPLLSKRERAVDVPTAIEALVHRCLAKAPGDRPQNGRAFLHELDRAMAAEIDVAVNELADDAGTLSGPRQRRRVTRGWVVGAVLGAIAALAVVALWPGGASRDHERAASLLRRAETAFAAGRYDGPGGAIVLTDLLLTISESDPAAIDLRLRMLQKLEADARDAEREGRLATAIERLVLAERLAPTDATLRERRQRLEGLLHSGEPAVSPAPQPPSPAPDVIAGAGDREVRVEIDPGAPVAGRRVTLKAIVRGFPEKLERSHFHVRLASAAARTRPAVVDATKSGDSTYVAPYEFPRAGRWVIAFSSHVHGSTEHLDQAIEVNVAAAGAPSPSPSPSPTPTPTPTPTPETPTPTPTPETPTPTPETPVPTPTPETPTPTPTPTPAPDGGSSSTSPPPEPPTPAQPTPPPSSATTTKTLAPGQPPPPTVKRRRR